MVPPRRGGCSEAASYCTTTTEVALNVWCLPIHYHSTTAPSQSPADAQATCKELSMVSRDLRLMRGNRLALPPASAYHRACPTRPRGRARDGRRERDSSSNHRAKPGPPVSPYDATTLPLCHCTIAKSRTSAGDMQGIMYGVPRLVGRRGCMFAGRGPQTETRRRSRLVWLVVALGLSAVSAVLLQRHTSNVTELVAGLVAGALAAAIAAVCLSPRSRRRRHPTQGELPRARRTTPGKDAEGRKRPPKEGTRPS